MTLAPTQAGRLFKRALSVRELAPLGQEPPGRGALVNNMANMYLAMGRHSDALPLYACAL